VAVAEAVEVEQAEHIRDHIQIFHQVLAEAVAEQGMEHLVLY
jgi:hypothetical protein